MDQLCFFETIIAVQVGGIKGLVPCILLWQQKAALVAGVFAPLVHQSSSHVAVVDAIKRLIDLIAAVNVILGEMFKVFTKMGHEAFNVVMRT